MIWGISLKKRWSLLEKPLSQVYNPVAGPVQPGVVCLPHLRVHEPMTGAAELYVLQEIDLAIDTRKAQLAAVESQLGETEELLSARRGAAEKQEPLRELRENQKQLEELVEQVRGKAAAIEKKLYGGTIRNPKELEDLQADFNALQAQVRRREDDLLLQMVRSEEAEEAFKEAEKVLREVERRWQADQEALLNEKTHLETELNELEERRQRQAKGYASEALALYDVLRSRKDGRAVVKVERGMCGGCRITLPMSLLQKAKAGSGLVQCVSCERLLFIS